MSVRCLRFYSNINAFVFTDRRSQHPVLQRRLKLVQRVRAEPSERRRAARAGAKAGRRAGARAGRLQRDRMHVAVRGVAPPFHIRRRQSSRHGERTLR